jgi:hypothetical protein
MAAGAPGPVENFKAGMRDCGFIERETVRYELRVAHGIPTSSPASRVNWSGPPCRLDRGGRRR